MKVSPAKSSVTGKLLLKFYRLLHAVHGEPACALHYNNPYQLLVAAVLSAQCTDVRVNLITGALFKKYPDAAALAKAGQGQLETVIQSAGLFRSKAKNLIAAARKIVADYGGAVPDTMAALITLPGVGRKTANVLLGNAFNIPGFPVDTHVKRVLFRLAVTASESPEQIEQEINQILPAEYWTGFSHLLIMHGRQVCHARTPDCPNCCLNNYCLKIQKKI